MVDSQRKGTEQDTSEGRSRFRSGEQPFVESRIIGVSKQRADAQSESGEERAEAGKKPASESGEKKAEGYPGEERACAKQFSAPDRIEETFRTGRRGTDCSTAAAMKEGRDLNFGDLWTQEYPGGTR